MEFTNNGIKTQTLREMYTELESQYKSIYGFTNDLDASSPDAQRIGITAQIKHDIQSFAVALQNSFDPDFADGLALQKILKLTGIFIRPATQSTWDLEVESTRTATLPGGYKVTDDLSQEWEIDSDINLIAGITTVTFKSVLFGEIEGLASSTITQATPENYVVEILAPSDAIVGSDAETVDEIRTRRNRSLENPAYSTIGSMFAKLGNVSGVTDLAVFENDTDIDEVDIPKRTLWIIVEGGEVADITESIVKQKTAGVSLKGSVEGVYIENIDTPSGGVFVYTHTAKFDRPAYTNIYISLDVKSIGGGTIDTELIKQELENATFTIGESIKASELYSFANNAGSNFTVSNLEISKDGITFNDDLLEANKDEKLVIDGLNITITEL